MAEEKNVARLFRVKTPVKEFDCSEERAKYYVEAEAENEDVELEVFEITKTKKGEEKLTKVKKGDL